MNKIYWRVPNKHKVPAASLRISLAGYHFFIWPTRDRKKWRGQVYRSTELDVGQTFASLPDPELAEIGLRHAYGIDPVPQQAVLDEVRDRTHASKKDLDQFRREMEAFG